VRAALALLLAAVVVASGSPPAAAGGAGYRFDGGTSAERRAVAAALAALAASTFDWSIVPAEVTIHIAPDVETRSAPAEIWLDSGLLTGGRFAWGLIQHEYAHQVDFFLLDAAARATLTAALGGDAWCYEVPGLPHQAYGCERFASNLAWAYWPSKDNCLRPLRADDEAGSLPPARFRSLLTQLLALPTTRP
jgi:hypothetical protein